MDGPGVQKGSSSARTHDIIREVLENAQEVHGLEHETGGPEREFVLPFADIVKSFHAIMDLHDFESEKRSFLYRYLKSARLLVFFAFEKMCDKYGTIKNNN